MQGGRRVEKRILATFAEFEADLIRLRTREGMAVARAKKESCAASSPSYPKNSAAGLSLGLDQTAATAGDLSVQQRATRHRSKTASESVRQRHSLAHGRCCRPG